MFENTRKTNKGLMFLMMAVVLTLGVGFAQEADCGGFDRPIVFAGLDWDSAQLHNAIAQYILEEGYGCQTDAIPGSTVPMLQGMIRGDIDVTMEIWAENVREAWDEALANEQVLDLGVNFPDATQGFFVPRYLIEGDVERGIEALAPNLKAVSDLPQYAELFKDPEEPDKGRFYNCIIGWGCEEVNNAKLEVYGLNEYFTNFRPGTGVALASSMEGAYLRGRPWLGYYWGPTWVLGKLDMVMLEEPEWSQACWDELTSAGSEATQACAYPTLVVTVGVNKSFADAIDPAVIDFLTAYETSNALVSELLAYMQDNDVGPEAAAKYFLETQAELWSAWVSEDVAARLQASLQ